MRCGIKLQYRSGRRCRFRIIALRANTQKICSSCKDKVLFARIRYNVLLSAARMENKGVIWRSREVRYPSGPVGRLLKSGSSTPPSFTPLLTCPFFVLGVGERTDALH